MLSKETIEKYAQIIELTNELEAQIQVETDGRFSLCNNRYLQLWADPAYPHTLEEVRELGCEVDYVKHDDRYTHVRFSLGGYRGSVLLRREEVAIIDIDAALSMDGGADDDVKANPNA